MATVVVSGRIDEELKRRADMIIRREGSSVGNVINDVWQSIVETGHVPQTNSQLKEKEAQQAKFNAFLDWFNALPSQNPAYANMTDDEILAMRVSDHA